MRTPSKSDLTSIRLHTLSSGSCTRYIVGFYSRRHLFVFGSIGLLLGVWCFSVWAFFSCPQLGSVRLDPLSSFLLCMRWDCSVHGLESMSDTPVRFDTTWHDMILHIYDEMKI
jgi:hypothetical protein